MDDMGTVRQFALSVPDSEVGSAIVDRLINSVDLVLAHDSGRPWLLVRNGTDPVIHHSVGAKQIAIIGPTSARDDDLRRLLSACDSTRELVRSASNFDGSFVVFATIAGELIARGPAVQTRRVFSSHVSGVHLLSDRSDVLAALGDNDIDTSRVRLQLVLGLPSPVEDQPVWTGVNAVPGDEYAATSADGGSLRLERWWTRPAPVLSRREGADRLRQALEAAVAVRTAYGTPVVADLSGGLDSTPVCFFASQGPHGCVAKTVYTSHPGGLEDLLWAKKALPSMPGVREHATYSVDDMPGFFNALDVPLTPDEPTDASLIAPRQLRMLEDDAERGATVHLTGNGGDHLFRGIPNWYQHVYRSDPKEAWRQVRSDQLFEKHRKRRLRQQLADQTPYQDWYSSAVVRGLADVSGTQLPIPLIDDWSIPVEISTLLTTDSRASVGDELRDLASNAGPLGASPAEHFDLLHLRIAGKAARAMSQIGEPVGVRVDAPLLDDHVVEAVLAVAYHERDTPIEWKPLMKAAMSELLPTEYLARTTKTGGGAQAIQGYMSNYSQLVDLWDEAGIFDHGWFERPRFLQETQPRATHEPSKFVYRITNIAMFLKAQRNRSMSPL